MRSTVWFIETTNSFYFILLKIPIKTTPNHRPDLTPRAKPIDQANHWWQCRRQSKLEGTTGCNSLSKKHGVELGPSPMDPHGAVTFDHPKNPRLAVNPPGWGWSLHLQLWSCRPGASCPTSTCLHMCDSISVEVTSNWRWLKSHTFLQVIEDASCFWVCPIPGTGEHHRTPKSRGSSTKKWHIFIVCPLVLHYSTHI